MQPLGHCPTLRLQFRSVQGQHNVSVYMWPCRFLPHGQWPGLAHVAPVDAPAATLGALAYACLSCISRVYLTTIQANVSRLDAWQAHCALPTSGQDKMNIGTRSVVPHCAAGWCNDYLLSCHLPDSASNMHICHQTGVPAAVFHSLS